MKYFASYREKTGKNEEIIEENVTTVDDLLNYLQKNYDIPIESAIVAVNRQVASREKEITDDDEVAVFPPVSGG